MKYYLILIFFLFTSCSNHSKSKSGFNFVIQGALTELVTSGGAYIFTVDPTNNNSTLYKLDINNSTNIPFGTYNLFIVGYTGPGDRAGTMYCANLNNVKFSTSDLTLTINVTSAECSSTIYNDVLAAINPTVTGKWDSDKYDVSHWGP